MKIKRIISLFLIFMLSASSLTSCKENSQGEQSTTPEETSEENISENSLLLYDGENFLAPIIRPEFTTNIVITSMQKLRSALAKLANNTNPMLKDDFIKNESQIGEVEILVGKTNRPATKALLENRNAYSSFSFSVNKSGIAICGTSDIMTEAGVDYFIENYLPENAICVDNSLYIKFGEYSSEKVFPSVGEYVSFYEEKNKTPSFSCEKLIDLPSVENHTILQGGCVDNEGKYAYFLFEKNNVSSIAKYDFETLKLVATRYDIGTDHSNDACYNSKLDAVVVVHNAPNYRLISLFDANTLERITKPVEFSESIYSIAYDEVTDSYIVGLSGGYGFAILDCEFNILSTFSGVNTGYTRQGVDADREYVYFVQSSSKQYLVVYTWGGKHVGTYELPGINYEVENIFHVGTQFYVSCYKGSNKGGVLYKININ